MDEQNWRRLKRIEIRVFENSVRPNSFSKLISAACNFKNNAQETNFICLDRSLILSFRCNFFAYFKFHSDWGRVIGKIQQNELDYRDTAPLSWIDLVCTCLWRLTKYLLTQMKMKPFQKLYLKHQHDITSPLCVILCHNLLNNQNHQLWVK